MRHVLLDICRKMHKQYVVESHAERHKKKGKFVSMYKNQIDSIS